MDGHAESVHRYRDLLYPHLPEVHQWEKPKKNRGSGAERDALRSRCVTVVVEARDRSFGCPRCSTVELNPNRENALDRDVQMHVFCGPSPQLRGPRLTERR